MPSQSRRGFLAGVGAVAVSEFAIGRDHPLREPPPDAREYLFAPGLAYMNTAALGPTPRAVIEKTLAAWRELESNPSDIGYRRQRDAMNDVRARAAQLLGCTLDEMILTESTSSGMNAVAQGIALTAGQRVLTTDQEHPGGQMCWKHYARRQRAIIDTIALPLDEHDPKAIVDRFAAAITPETRVISVSHVLSSTGLRMPIAEIAALARARGCLCVVDGAQAVGAIDVNVKALGCHAYATSGHKWLMGPKGTGLLYIGNDAKEFIDPILLEDGRGAYTESTGVRNSPAVIGLGVAIDAARARGMPALERGIVGLRTRLWEELRKTMARVTIVSPPPGPGSTPLVTFRLPDAVDSRALVLTLREKYRVEVKPVPKNWLNGIRVSTHVFNTDHDAQRLVRALRAELS